MLLAINDRIKGWLGIFIIFLIAIPFALWGVESYIGGGTEQHAAIIDDIEISASKLDRDVSRMRQNIARDQSRKMPDDKQLRQDAIEQIINTTILEQASESQGYQISDQVLGENIRDLFTRNGEFDVENYQQVIANQGMTPSMFENLYRAELRVNQYRNSITTSAIAPIEEVRRLLELQQQVRDIRWLKLNGDKLVGNIDITDEQIQAYYDEHAQRYMKPAQVSIEYVELSVDTIKGIEIDEGSVRKRYEEYVEQQQQREERKTRHILLTTEAGTDKALNEIEDIRAKLIAGADFSQLAKQYSKDPGSAEEGGDLGWVTTGQMVKPFEDALFNLEPGQLSGVVKTEFGYHLIKVDDVRSGEIVAYEEKQAEFREQLRRDEIDSVMYDLSELMANTAYENQGSLEPVAEALELPIQSSQLFTRNSGSGIAMNPAVRQAAFSDIVLKQGENSELIELASDHVIVLRVKQHNEATPLGLDKVRTRIRQSLIMMQAQQRVNQIADEIIDSLRQGATVESVLRDGVEDQGKTKVDRASAAQFNRSFVDKVMSFAIPENDEVLYDKASLGTGDVAVIALHKVEFPAELDKDTVERMKANYRQSRAVEEFTAVVTSYKDKTDIQINQKVIEDE